MEGSYVSEKSSLEYNEDLTAVVEEDSAKGDREND